jgi:hypothetical protein
MAVLRIAFAVLALTVAYATAKVRATQRKETICSSIEFLDRMKREKEKREKEQRDIYTQRHTHTERDRERDRQRRKSHLSPLIPTDSH